MEHVIGCTGWSYPGWAGTFYPKRLKGQEWLEYYSTIFDSTEINSTFYRVPPRGAVRRWDAATPDGFRFTAKFPRSITHEKRLERAGPEMHSFLSALAPIREKLEAVVLQLPPSLGFAEARPRLDDMLDMMPGGLWCPVEGRHPSWFTDEAISYARGRNMCLVWGEVAGVNNTWPVTSDRLYLRLVGDRSIPDSEFGRVSIRRGDRIAWWAQKLKATPGVRRAVIMANNHYEGFAPATADSLGRALGRRRLAWEERRQGTLGF